MWSIILDLEERPPEDRRLAIEAALEPLGEALSSFERDRGKAWRIEILCSQRPARRDLAQRLRGLCREQPRVQALRDKDWVRESEMDLPPISVGPFFVHGSHFNGQVPRGSSRAPRFALCIDAGMAFGTGRHQTTLLCLRALIRLSRARHFHRPLDLGTGTGILALAMACLWDGSVLAADNDKDAVRIAAENARLNGLGTRVKVVLADRYASPSLRRRAPFDLVTANILAGPLIDLAPGLARSLAPGGRAILSGLLSTQEQPVLDAHRSQGLDLESRLRLKGWSALVLAHARKRKPAAG